MSINKVEVIGIANFPLVKPGDDLGELVLKHANSILERDIIVIAQKIVSKAEDRLIWLDSVKPSSRAQELARQTGRSPEFCELVLRESKSIIETKGKVIVVEHNNGMVCTSAGIDKSNIDQLERQRVVLLPLDADASADNIRRRIEVEVKEVAVIISDSLGHPNREGSIGAAIGFSGISALEQKTGPDLYGKIVKPLMNMVDRVAAAASIVMGESAEGKPVVIVRGVNYTRSVHSRLRDILIKPSK